MSDFQEYLAEQLKDPVFRRLWEASPDEVEKIIEEIEKSQ